MLLLYLFLSFAAKGRKRSRGGVASSRDVRTGYCITYK